jgi:tRNA A37 threonylcarbamoyltransferase TsaD
MSYELRTALTLPLFMTRVLTYYPDNALASDNTAFIANFAN